MNEQNKELLNEVVEDRLNLALTEEDEDKNKTAFKEAMEAVNKCIDLEKVEKSTDESVKNRKIQLITFGAGLVLAPIIEVICKNHFVNKVGKIEQMETFTSSAGRSLGGNLFKFKK